MVWLTIEFPCGMGIGNEPDSLMNWKKGKRHYKKKQKREERRPHGYWSEGYIKKIKAGLK